MIAEPSRAGLADEVRAALGERVVDVRLEDSSERQRTRTRSNRATRTPSQQFASYLADRGVDDPRLQRAFDQLLDELSTPDDETREPDGSQVPATPFGGRAAEQLSLGT